MSVHSMGEIHSISNKESETDGQIPDKFIMEKHNNLKVKDHHSNFLTATFLLTIIQAVKID